MGKTLTIKKIDKSKAYDAWIQFRTNGLGGSEIGTVMGVNSWKSPAELYYQKLGLIPQKVDQNIPMFMGTIMEALVADLFSYWDSDDKSMMANHDAKTPVRKLYEPIGYMINEEYPHLFFSPDRLQISKDIRIRDEKINLSNVEAVIEIKTISGWSSKQWDGGIPPAYYLQVQTYLMGLGIDKAYLVSLEDGRNLKVHQFDRDDEIIDMIQSVTTDFWERVTLGREAVTNGEDYDQFAPGPDGTMAYEKFLNEKFKNPEEKTIKSNNDIDGLIAKYIQINEDIKQFEEEQRFCTNHIKEYMGENTILDSDIARVTWRPNKNGTRVFRL